MLLRIVFKLAVPLAAFPLWGRLLTRISWMRTLAFLLTPVVK